MTAPAADAAKLLPCPWCNHPPLGAVLNNALEPEKSMYLLQCPGGKCRVHPKVCGRDRAEAEQRWNTRPQPAAPAGEPDFMRHAETFARKENAPFGVERLLRQFGERMYRLGLSARAKVEDAGVQDTVRWLRSFGDTGSAPLFNRAADLLGRLAGDFGQLQAALELANEDLRIIDTKLAEREAKLAGLCRERDAVKDTP